MTDSASPDSSHGSLSSGPSGKETGRAHFEVWILFAFSCLLYIATTGHDFVVDDSYMVGSPYVKSFHYLRQIFGHSFWSLVGQTGTDNYYRPLITVTILVEHALFGVRPAWYHLINVLLNGAVVVFVYRLAKYWWPWGRAALWAGLLFAVLPLHSENVAPVSGISDLGCALFMVLCLGVYVRDVDSGGHPRRARSWLAAGLLLAAAFYKEVAVMLPLLLIFYELAANPSQPREFRGILRRLLPIFLVTALYMAIRLEAVGGFASFPQDSELGLWETLLSAFSLTGMYIYKLVWPQHLSYFLSFHPPRNWHNLYVLLGMLGTLLGGISFFRYRKSAPLVSFAVLWFFLTLAPVLNVHWLVFSPYGERFLYIPSIGLCWLAGLGLARLTDARTAPSRTRRLGYALVAVILVLSTIRIVLRLPEWKNNIVLAEATLREDSSKGIFCVYAGNAYLAEGDRNKAREQYVKALALDPGCVQAYLALAGIFIYDQRFEPARLLLRRATQLAPHDAGAYYDRGVLELQRGARARARQLFEYTITLNPYYGDALNNLGALELDDGQLDKAQGLLERAVEVDPLSVQARLNLGAVFAGKRQFPQAEREFRQAVQIAPQNCATYLALARLYELEHEDLQALAVYQETVRADPNCGNAQFRLGVLALRMGKVAEARSALERAVAIQPDSPIAHLELGLAYLNGGKPGEARKELETCLRLDPTNETASAALRKIP